MATDVISYDPGIRLKQRLSRYAVLISIGLLALKFWAWTVSQSLAVLSDALNSLLDVFSYGTLAICVRVQDAEPDLDHPYGHRRAEPLASMLIAVFAALLGFNLVKDGILGLISPPTLRPAPVVIYVMAVAIMVKIGMVYAYNRAWRKTGSLAIQASMVDSRNDIMATSVALLGFVVGGQWDSLAAAAIGLWIIWSGVRIGMENLGYLMGRSPSKDTLAHLRATAMGVPGVEGTNSVIAHYVGDKLHVEIHAEVDPALSVGAGHEIATELQERLEDLPKVGKAFIHLEPALKPKH